MKLVKMLATCAALTLSGGALSQGKPIAPAPTQVRGVYATIDVRKSQDMERRLASGGDRRAAVREVMKEPGSYAPPVLYALANVLSGDRPEDAIFWYHVGRVRAVYDAFRCSDASARNVIPLLGKKLSPELVRSQYYQRDQLVGLAQKAIDWDAKNPRNYDQRWVCLLGKVAATSPGTDPAEVQKPESEWPAIHKHVRDAHLKSVKDFAAEKPVK